MHNKPKTFRWDLKLKLWKLTELLSMYTIPLTFAGIFIFMYLFIFLGRVKILFFLL